MRLAPRRGLAFLLVAAGFACLFVWGVSGLPMFGHYPGPYGDAAITASNAVRHTTNIPTTIVFDIRGFDTLGEESILFMAALGVALVFREVREQDADQLAPIADDEIRLQGVILVPVLAILGLQVIAHGPSTPGGGFQGGVILAGAAFMVFLAGSWKAYRALTPEPAVELLEAVGVGGYAVTGLVILLFGGAYLENVLPLGEGGQLDSGGTIALLNWLSGIAVVASFTLLFREFMTEMLTQRPRR
jgi:multicomponent Na+:H+ antiporter subunit B